MGTAAGFDDTQVSQRQRHGFGFHGRAAIGMHGELTGRDILRAATMLDRPPASSALSRLAIIQPTT
jgi:hypothetical protein